LPETAWLLDGAETLVGYNPASASNPFQYAETGGESFPVNQITNEQNETSASTTSGFQVGVSAAKSPSGTFQWSSSTTLGVDTTVNVPDWSVTPNADPITSANASNTSDNPEKLPVGGINVFYNWATNTPLSYKQITSCDTDCGLPFGTGSNAYNTLNGSTWSPQSQTQFSGDQTGGYPVFTTYHGWAFGDHYSVFEYTAHGTDPSVVSVHDLFQFYKDYGSSSSTASTQFGSQEIDLCDPLVTSANALPPLCS
jgi:hypothetical protein